MKVLFKLNTGKTLCYCGLLFQPTLFFWQNCKFTVCGDIHGQFYDLLNIFDLNDQPSPENPYVSFFIIIRKENYFSLS